MHGTYVQVGERRVTRSSSLGNEFPKKEMHHVVCSYCGLIEVSHTPTQAAKAALEHKKKFN